MSDDKTVKSGFSRRSVLKGTAAAAGVAVGSGAVKGFPTLWAQNLKDITLRSVGSGVTHIDPYKQMAEEDLGFKLEFTVLDFLAIRTRGITQPRSFDIFEPTYNDYKKIWPTGNFQAVDSDRLKHWARQSTCTRHPARSGPTPGLARVKTRRPFSTPRPAKGSISSSPAQASG